MGDLRSSICPDCGKAHSALEDCRDYVLAPTPVGPVWDGTRWSDDDPKTDAEKHAYCMRRTGHCATYLSPNLYALGERDGHDMRPYVKTQPLPRPMSGGHGEVMHRIDHLMPTGDEMRTEITRKIEAGEPLGARPRCLDQGRRVRQWQPHARPRVQQDRAERQAEVALSRRRQEISRRSSDLSWQRRGVHVRQKRQLCSVLR
jgi:hypothetical protein